MKRRALRLIAAALTLSALPLWFGGCGVQHTQDEIVVLFTNDVHGATEEGIGYAGLAAYTQYWQQQTPYVALVDCGDAIQGDSLSTATRGESAIDLMNQLGYDFAVPGNHEFDYGIDRFAALLEESEAQYICCNLAYSGEQADPLSAIKPYEIVPYGDIQVAFLGIATPESIAKSAPTYFMDDSGRIVYDFFGDSGEALYTQIQDTVEECRAQGADYVIALSHLGTAESSAPFRSVDVIAATTGIDAVLDGHSHSVIPCDMVRNREGALVPLVSTGTGLTHIGQLVISPQGTLTAGLISGYPEQDPETLQYIQDARSTYETALQQPVGTSTVDLTTTSPQGIRLVRCRETNLGDFCADAYREISGADIALVNGGGIRADLPAGEITYETILRIHPYGNTLCVAEATGQQILDALEMASRSVLPTADDGQNATGENGGFLQVSGLRYTVDTSVASTVELDSAGMFVSCGANRRVKDVKVLQPDGSYTPLDPQKVYTVASHNYLIKQGGDGLCHFMEDNLLLDEGMADYQVLITYITEHLGGTIGEAYRAPGERITVL